MALIDPIRRFPAACSMDDGSDVGSGYETDSSEVGSGYETDSDLEDEEDARYPEAETPTSKSL